MNARQITGVVIRGFAVGFALIAVLAIASGLLRVKLEHPNFPMVFYPRSYRDELRWAIPFLALAIALWVFQRPLSRLIVPKFGPTCPECGYDLRRLKGDRCPECGTTVSKRSASQ